MKKSVLIIGPDPALSQGGMASVIANILGNASLNSQFDLALYPSFVDGPLLKRAAYSISKELAFSRTRHQADVYHIHISSGTSVWRKLHYLEKLGVRRKNAVLHAHGSRFHLFYEGCSDRQKKKIQEAYTSAGKVVVLSEEWKEFFLANHICPPENIEVLYNAVEIPDSNETDYDNQVVLFMGRLGERKDPETLLRAAKEVLIKHLSARFVFGGDAEVDRYRRIAEELGIAGNCTFAGWVSGIDKETLYRSASVYCLPSRNEGMPMSVLEAMSYGLATIATPVGGIPRVITDGVDGMLVPVGDSAQLAKQIDKLLENPALKARIGEAARETVIRRFGMDAFAERLAHIYTEAAR